MQHSVCLFSRKGSSAGSDAEGGTEKLQKKTKQMAAALSAYNDEVLTMLASEREKDAKKKKKEQKCFGCFPAFSIRAVVF